LGLFSDHSLSDNDRKAIHDFALAARELLISEARDQLEGIYGLKPDGHLAPLDHLPNLQNDPEGLETYRQLKNFLEEEVKAGLDRQEAIEKLVKEVSFTHLNRLVAFKMMETRKLIKQAVGKGTKSNGFMFYMVEHPEDEALWNMGGEGVDRAYRHFLLWQAEQIASEIQVLFDVENLPSKLFPRSVALNNIIYKINADDLTSAWETPETIGWIYQFFNEQEKVEVFDRLFKQKQKIRRQDIPAATQLFTPRWIVRFLVENTLGRLWVQMHPDTRLKGDLRYLVPLADNVPSQPIRRVQELTLLDPACGTMHFGLVAFDLLAEMYHEEMDCAGKSGWPETPSVSSKDEIPSAIIKNNLFGIEIDLRAVQLSALTLYLKAKDMNKDARITDSNLACADVLALNGSRLTRFIRAIQFRPIYERLLKKLWERLEEINQLGSLLRLEREIDAMITAERVRFDRKGRQLDLFGAVQKEFEFEAAQNEYWEILATQLLQSIDHFGKISVEEGIDERFFTQEARKGLRVLDIMLRRYDCVVTNPPYMSRRNMNDSLAMLLARDFPEAKGDLYAAFILRCCEFTEDQGRVGMITQQSFMFISSYETLRNHLLGEFAIETMAHTGPKAFAEISGEKVNTTAFILRREPDPIRRANSIGTYFRLVHEADAESKRLAFERALAELKAMQGVTNG